MGLITSHFQEKAVERFGREMTEQEAHDYWARGYPITKKNLYHLPMRIQRHSVYRIVIIDHIPAIMVKNTLTHKFRTVF